MNGFYVLVAKPGDMSMKKGGLVWLSRALDGLAFWVDETPVRAVWLSGALYGLSRRVKYAAKKAL